MKTICDTHVMLFWADRPQKLSKPAAQAIETGMEQQTLACADISLWEIAMLFAKGRLNNQAGVAIDEYIEDIIDALELEVLPITPQIAALAQHEAFTHGDPADRLIAATTISHNAQLITADHKLRNIPQNILATIW